mgnify:CR=1 FL=1
MSAPILVYDDECGFCMYMIQWLLRFGEFNTVGYSELTVEQENRLPDEYDTCMHLLTADAVYSCGKALEQSVATFGVIAHTSVQVVSQVPCWREIREYGYRFVADRRSIWGRYRSCEHVNDDVFDSVK